MLVGTNASGKSNIRDAFRFLHAIGRGYRLIDILGGKYEGGDEVWKGIRGGPLGLLPQSNATVAFEVTFISESTRRHPVRSIINDRYTYELELRETTSEVRVSEERLLERKTPLFWTEASAATPRDVRTIKAQFRAGGTSRKGHVAHLQFDAPIIVQATEGLRERRDAEARRVQTGIDSVLQDFRMIRFLDLDPEALRRASYPAQVSLGDRGENLSSVLFAVCLDPHKLAVVTEWLQALTPMDVIGLEFPQDHMGRVSLVLVESNGRKTGVASASDGTLRFLGYLALVFSEDTPRLCFIEEIDNGIHPTRLHLLVELLQTQTLKQKLQIVATSHSPVLLRLLDPKVLSTGYLVYRNPESNYSETIKISELPNFNQLIEDRDPANLMESGWFENTVIALRAHDEEEVAS